jgi:ABC-type glycerol-3-phosphate transport system substrate-binding protein
MVEIEFSVMEGYPGDSNKLLPLLEAFEKQYHIHVNLTGILWAHGWTEIAKFGIYGHGPDVSAIGTTWVGSLAAMRALRPFSEQQVRALGGGEAFFESIWKTGFLPDDTTPWAIPWLGNAFVLYYWKDALEKAGVHDLETAFTTNAGLAGALKKLRESGLTYPMALNTTRRDVALHEAAHWVWSAGGDFVSADRRQVAFHEPAAMQGWKNYFSLQPFLSPEWLNSVSAAGDSFRAHASAIQIEGTYMTASDALQRPEGGEQLGIALASGTAVVGGASFVIWGYTPHPDETFQLVRFLSSQPMRIPASPHSHELPTRREALRMPSIENDFFHHTYLQAMQTGRSYPATRLWGSIEEKLVLEISRIWAELFTNPGQDLDTLLHKHFDPLAQRLNAILEG